MYTTVDSKVCPVMKTASSDIKRLAKWPDPELAAAADLANHRQHPQDCSRGVRGRPEGQRSDRSTLKFGQHLLGVFTQ
jgi:hypothetical protein